MSGIKQKSNKMVSLKNVQLLSIIVSLTIIATGRVMASHPAIKAAYWPSWSQSFPPSSIDTTLFTHVYYAFVIPNNVTFEFDIPDSTSILLNNFTTTLHNKNPPVKTLLSIGGGGVDPQIFARMASQAKSRKIFIDSTIDVARKYGFDGLDLDWESPENPQQMEDLGELFQQWRSAIQDEAEVTNQQPLLLTAATYFSVAFFLDQKNYRKYPVPSIRKNLDWIGAMCYSYHGVWDTTATGAPAALYDPNSNISTSYGLRSWIGAGMPRERLVMGLPLFGSSWKLKDPNVNGIGAPAVATGPGDGDLTFSQIEKFNKDNGATVVYDVETVSVYSYAGSSWIGYDDALSTTTKIGYAQALGLRGYFFWALGYDNEWKISKQASRAWVIDN